MVLRLGPKVRRGIWRDLNNFARIVGRVEHLGQEFGVASNTRPIVLAHLDHIGLVVQGAPNNPAELLRLRQTPHRVCSGATCAP